MPNSSGQRGFVRGCVVGRLAAVFEMPQHWECLHISLGRALGRLRDVTVHTERDGASPEDLALEEQVFAPMLHLLSVFRYYLCF